MKKMIKIGVIGTHGTRKTSLCYDFAGRLRSIGINAGIMEEVARNLPRFPGFDINEGTTRESQQWIIHSQIKKELEYLARGDVNPLFTDRAVIDNYMYYLYKFGNDNQALDALVNDWTKTYDLLVKLPILENKCLKTDSVRATNPEFQIGIDRLLEKELEIRGIPFHVYTTTEVVIEKVMLLMEKK